MKKQYLLSIVPMILGACLLAFLPAKEVLIEEVRDHQTGLLTGYTDNYLKVLTEGPDELKNKLVKVKLEESVDSNHLKGKIIN